MCVCVCVCGKVYNLCSLKRSLKLSFFFFFVDSFASSNFIKKM